MSRVMKREDLDSKSKSTAPLDAVTRLGMENVRKRNNFSTTVMQELVFQCR